VQVSTVTQALDAPVAVAAAGPDRTIVLDGNRVLQIDGSGQVSLLAGGDTPGSDDGMGPDARFFEPRGVVVAPDGTCYVADTSNHRIRAIDPNGRVTTLAGSTLGFADGVGPTAQLDTPSSIARRSDGTLVVADTWNHRLREVSLDGTVRTLCGDGNPELIDGPCTSAELNFPFGVTVFPDDSLAIVEAATSEIRKVTAGASPSIAVYAGELDRIGWADGTADTASVSETTGLLALPDGELLLLDGASSRLRALQADGSAIDTLAGGLHGSLRDGPGSAAGFELPRSAAVAADGSLLVIDTGHHALRRVTLP
jgi:DNA-binding beta-propeller fold protein YncE